MQDRFEAFPLKLLEHYPEQIVRHFDATKSPEQILSDVEAFLAERVQAKGVVAL